MKHIVAFLVISTIFFSYGAGQDKYDLGKTDVQLGMGYGLYEGLIEIPSNFPYLDGEFNLKVYRSHSTNNHDTASCRARVKKSLVSGGKKMICFDIGDLAIILYGEANLATVNAIAFNSLRWEAKR